MAKKSNQAQMENDSEHEVFAPQRKRALVVPTMSIKELAEGASLFVRFAAEPQTRAQTINSGKDKGAPKVDPDTGEPLTITSAQVIDMRTGAIGELVLGFMVCKALAAYTEPLTGMEFEFVKGKKSGRTTMWEVYEL